MTGHILRMPSMWTRPQQSPDTVLQTSNCYDMYHTHCTVNNTFTLDWAGHPLITVVCRTLAGARVQQHIIWTNDDH